MSLAERFLELYNQLEEAMRERLGCPQKIPHAQLIEMLSAADPVFRDQASRLQAYRALRNSIVHMPRGRVEEPIAEPRPDVVEDYERVISYLLHPPRALDKVAVRKIFTVGWQSEVHVALRHMLEHSFTVAPIIEDAGLVGMLSHTTLMRIVVAHGGINMDDHVTFERFQAECGLEAGHPDVLLRPADMTIPEVEKEFSDAFQHQLAISAVLLTEHGSPREPLLGLITAYDLPSTTGARII